MSLEVLLCLHLKTVDAETRDRGVSADSLRWIPGLMGDGEIHHGKKYCSC